jgi:predicted amidohydrolase
MKICLAQIKSIKGNIQENIKPHLKFIHQAVTLSAHLIVFPELSLTSYAPDLAKELATSVEDILFEPFQTIANKYKLTLCIGMPIKQLEGITISLLIFQANKKRTKYSKQILHTDESPYFIAGTSASFLSLKGEKIALGICYETLQTEHFLNAKENGATIYVASVAKPIDGIKKPILISQKAQKNLSFLY